MKSRIFKPVILILSLMVALCVVFIQPPGIAAAAANFSLSGKVTDQPGNPIPGVVIKVLDLATGNTLASATTDASGHYALSLPAGTYNISVTPPIDSGFQAFTLTGRAITSDTPLDFTLVPAGAITLKGKVLDALGNGLANQSFSLTNAAGSWQLNVGTDDQGNYAFNVPSGDYTLDLQANNADPTKAPHYYSLNTNSFSLLKNTTFDLTLPFKKVSVHVQDPAGNPVANAALTTNAPNNANLSLGPLTTSSSTSYYSNPTYTDASGDATLWLFPTDPAYGLYTLTATPPPDRTDVGIMDVSNIAVTKDRPLTITLPTTVTLSGRVMDASGNALANLTIYLINAVGAWLPVVQTDDLGNYVLHAAPGNYTLYLQGNNADPTKAPHTYILTTNSFSLLKDKTLNLILPPFKKVNVHVQDSADKPVANVAVSTDGPCSPNLSLGPITASCGYSYYSNPEPTDASGDATLWLYPAGYILTATPDRTGLATTNVSVTVTKDTSVTITLAATVTLSGRVLNAFGDGLENQRVYLINTASVWVAGVWTDVAGNYVLHVIPGDYTLNLQADNADPTNAPHAYDLTTNSFSLRKDTTLDLPLPLKKVSVHVQDPTGKSIANVALSTNGPCSSGLSLGPLTSVCGSSYYPNFNPIYTDASGDATLWLFPTDPIGGLYTLTAIPSSASGFALVNVPNIAVTSDKSQVIVLQYITPPTNHPPLITEGDSIKVIMDENGSPKPFALTLHATDADHDPLTWSILTPAKFGAASVVASTAVVSYKPGLNYNGAASFVVKVSDGHGGTDSIIVNITIQPGPYSGSLLWNQCYEIQYNGWIGVIFPKAFHGDNNLPTSGEFPFAADYGGYRKATSGNFTFKPAFAFTQVQWITHRGPDQGKAQVLVDGKVMATVDLYRATEQWQYLVTIGGLTNANHTVVIRALNAKNARSTGKWVVVDGFKIGAVRYDDALINTDLVRLTYDTWVGLRNKATRFEAYRISSKANTTMGFSFDGVKFDWTTARGPAYGKAEIYVDGSLQKTVDLYNPTQQWQYAVSVVVPYGHHVVLIKVLGTKNPASSGTGIVSDGFIIN